MEFIFHEKQEGSLCAQHCLNAVLQGSYFTAIDLAELGRRLDESEQEHMAEAGYSSEEYKYFMKQPSSNYDDSGFFSIQVLQEALKVWNLELIPINSSEPICQEARKDPRTQKAFVCNFKEHWFTIRHIGNQWFNLNSLLTSPELLSETFLSLFLKQLQHEGYSIFVLSGDLPPCEADEVLKLVPAVQSVKPKLLAEVKPGAGDQATTSPDEFDEDLQKAIEESRHLDEDNDKTLREALQLSMLDFHLSSPLPVLPENKPEEAVDVEGLRKQRLAFLSQSEPQQGQSRPSESPRTEQDQPELPTAFPTDDLSEETLLEMAIKLSMENSV